MELPLNTLIPYIYTDTDEVLININNQYLTDNPDNKEIADSCIEQTGDYRILIDDGNSDNDNDNDNDSDSDNDSNGDGDDNSFIIIKKHNVTPVESELFTPLNNYNVNDIVLLNNSLNNFIQERDKRDKLDKRDNIYNGGPHKVQNLNIRNDGINNYSIKRFSNQYISENLDDNNVINNRNEEMQMQNFGKRIIENYNNEDIVDELCLKLEILSTFVAGQKDIYLLSKNIMNFRQNFIMFISIFIGAIASLLSLKSCDDNSLLIITILNTIIVVLVGFASVFKFDVKGESYLHISNSYNKLEMHIENSTSELQIIQDKDNKIAYFLKQVSIIEENIGNLKDDNNYTIPYVVFSIYPILTKINIFKLIKLNGHLRNSLIDNSKINLNSNIYELIHTELFNEISEANKYKSFWIICYFFPPVKKDGIIRTHSIV